MRPSATLKTRFRRRGQQSIRTTARCCRLLHPDTEVRAGAIAALEEALRSRPRAGIVAPLVLNPDGSVQPTKRAFPTVWQSAMHGLAGLVWPGNPGTRAYTLTEESFGEPRTVGWAAGTAMAIRREASIRRGVRREFLILRWDVDLRKRLLTRDGRFGSILAP